MKKVYSTPDFMLIVMNLNDVVLVSTEGSIPETISSGGGAASTEFDDLP